MENTTHVRAQLVSVAIKNGIVLQFELESDSKDALPKIAMMARHFVELDITDEQMALDIKEGPVDGQLEADFDEPEEPEAEPEELEADFDEPEEPEAEPEELEADFDEPEAFEMVYEPRELPEPEYVTGAFDDEDEEADDEEKA